MKKYILIFMLSIFSFSYSLTTPHHRHHKRMESCSLSDKDFNNLSKEQKEKLKNIRKIIFEKEIKIKRELRVLKKASNKAIIENNEKKYTRITERIRILRKELFFLRKLYKKEFEKIIENSHH